MKLEDLDKESLISIIKQVFMMLNQKYLCFPENKKLEAELSLKVMQPINALVNIIFDSKNPVDITKDNILYKPLSSLAIEYLEEAGCKIEFPTKAA